MSLRRKAHLQLRYDPNSIESVNNIVSHLSKGALHFYSLMDKPNEFPIIQIKLDPVLSFGRNTSDEELNDRLRQFGDGGHVFLYSKYLNFGSILPSLEEAHRGISINDIIPKLTKHRKVIIGMKFLNDDTRGHRECSRFGSQTTGGVYDLRSSDSDLYHRLTSDQYFGIYVCKGVKLVVCDQMKNPLTQRECHSRTLCLYGTLLKIEGELRLQFVRKDELVTYNLKQVDEEHLIKKCSVGDKKHPILFLGKYGSESMCWTLDIRRTRDNTWSSQLTVTEEAQFENIFEWEDGMKVVGESYTSTTATHPWQYSIDYDRDADPGKGQSHLTPDPLIFLVPQRSQQTQVETQSTIQSSGSRPQAQSTRSSSRSRSSSTSRSDTHKKRKSSKKNKKSKKTKKTKKMKKMKKTKKNKKSKKKKSKKKNRSEKS